MLMLREIKGVYAVWWYQIVVFGYVYSKKSYYKVKNIYERCLVSNYKKKQVTNIFTIDVNKVVVSDEVLAIMQRTGDILKTIK